MNLAKNSIRLIEVYPNPAQKEVNIDFPKTLEEVEVILLDATGSIIYSGKMNQSGSIDIQNYESSIYLVRFRTKENQTLKRIMITK